MKINSAQMLVLAARHHQAGNWLEAEQLCLQILQQEPGHVDAQYLLGDMDYRLGRPEQAVQRLRSLVQQSPNFSEAYNLLGIALHANGDPEEGVACFRQALRLQQNSAEALSNLGNALYHQGQLAEALASLQQAVALAPGFVEAHLNLGMVLQKLGRFGEAAWNYRQVLRFRPDYFHALNNLGGVLKEQGKLAEAAASIRQALFFNPDFAHSHYNLGCVLLLQEKRAEAIASIERALRLMPNHAQALTSLGKIHHEQGSLLKAKAFYEEALRLEPGYEIARCNLGTLLQHLGDFTGAEGEYRTVLRDHPHCALALWPLAHILRDKLPEPDCRAIEECLAQPHLKDTDRSQLLYALAEVCDAKGEYRQAAALVQQANALMAAVCRQNGQARDPGEHAHFVDNVIATFTPAFFERARGFGLQTERPVFIVGLPRSGTTLIEQILGAHSQVFAAGELQLAFQDYQALETQLLGQAHSSNLHGLSGDAVRLAAQRHLDQLGNLNSTAARVVDKMPENYLFLGLLAALFPRAKFIHCRRDLRDVAVSCWMTTFVNLRWCDDPEHIVVHIREYLRLMEHWRTVLPVPVLEVNYEETVADLSREARRVVEWCGLKWEPACLKFHESKRPVCTASVIQARQPIYMRSVGRWRHYERELSELFPALQPLVNPPSQHGGGRCEEGKMDQFLITGAVHSRMAYSPGEREASAP